MKESKITLIPQGEVEPLAPARSLPQVRRLMRRMGMLLRRRVNRRRKIEERMEALKKELLRLSDKLGDSPESAELRTLADRIYGYCAAHQEELEKRVEGRTVSFEDGSTFGWRNTPYALEVTDMKLLISSIRRARLTRQLVRWEPKIDLNRIKNDPDIRKKLRGIRYENKTLFRIEPAETDERLEAETGVEHPAWEIKRPRSRVIA